jgi:hypothetical protein
VRNAVPHTNRNPNCDSNSNTYGGSYGHIHAYCNSNAHGYTNGNSYAYGYCSAQSDPVTETTPDSGASVVLVDQ